MPGDRHHARILAMQALCQWDAQHDDSAEGLDEFLLAQRASPRVARYAAEIVKAFWTGQRRIDDRIAQATTRWDLPRISPVERNVMRVSVVEMLGEKVPPKVALNEAIEIGREFGGADSPRFINGVLDTVWQKLQQERKDDG